MFLGVRMTKVGQVELIDGDWYQVDTGWAMLIVSKKLQAMYFRPVKNDILNEIYGDPMWRCEAIQQFGETRDIVAAHVNWAFV